MGADTTSISFPTTAMKAWELKQIDDEFSSYIAGGTLIQMQREQGLTMMPHLISLDKISVLKHITMTDVGLWIGAGVTLNACSESHSLKENFPLLQEAIAKVASPAVRNRGTLGGNVVYFKGDTVPVLLLYDALVTCVQEGEERTIPLGEFLYERSRSLLTGIVLPVQKSKDGFFRKIERRQAFALSVLTVSGMMEIEKRKVTDIRLAIGGFEVYPRRLTSCERILSGEELTVELIYSVQKHIERELRVFQDHLDSRSAVLASNDYLVSVLSNIVCAYLYERGECQ